MAASDLRPTCPGCASVMSPFRVDGRPLALCSFCGGAWIEGEVLERLARRTLRLDPIEEADTSRRCPACTRGLEPVLVDATPVERCRACAGLYLDPGELEELARRRVALRPDEPAPRAPEAHDFRCPGCGERRPLEEGTATGRGYACMACAPAFDGGSAVLPPARGTTLNAPMPGLDGRPSFLGRKLGWQLDLISDLLFGGD